MSPPVRPRSPDSGPPETYHFDTFALDVGARTLRQDGRDIRLPSRAFDTLVHLVRHRDRFLGKDELIGMVWSDAFVSDDSLVHCVSVLRRALQDDTEHPRFIATLPRRGYQFIGGVDAPAEAAPPAPAASTPAAPARRPQLTALAWGASLTAVVLAAALVAGRSDDADPPTGPGPPVVLTQPAPPGTSLASGGAVSPDGTQLAFVARDDVDGTTRLWVRALDDARMRMLADTDGASKPFWSPDGQALGFFAGDSLKIVSLTDASTRTLAGVAVSPAGGAWNAQGLIVFGDVGSGLHVVSPEGGPARTLTTLDPAHDVAHAWPSFLPDGERVLYTVSSWNPDRAGIWVVALDGSTPPGRIVAAASAAVFAPTGHLLYVQDEALVAEAFDPVRLERHGPPSILARGVAPPRLLEGHFVSASGALLSYGGGTRAERLVWFDRAGRPLREVETPTTLYNPQLSPDGTLLVATGAPVSDPGLWLLNLDAATSMRLSPEGIGPLWSPDGQKVAYTTRGGLDVRMQNVGPGHESELLLGDDTRKALQDWSPDGTTVLYSRMNEHGHLDVWQFPVGGGGTGAPVLHSPANERQARISPDGRWLAYASDESGQWEVYVQAYRGVDEKRRVSAGGGGMPSWRADGRELFYLAPTRTLMSVRVESGSAITLSPPEPLFRVPVAGNLSEARNHYVATAAGDAFLFSVADDADQHALTILVNWTGQLSDPVTVAPNQARY
jgi:Tol biopolymer transport system component/DNA-binding winged helix-turn-helix (wHTH) protein